MKTTKLEYDLADEICAEWIAARPACTAEVACDLYSLAVDAAKGMTQGRKNAEAADKAANKNS